MPNDQKEQQQQQQGAAGKQGEQGGTAGQQGSAGIPPDLLKKIEEEVSGHARAALNGVQQQIVKLIPEEIGKALQARESALSEMMKKTVAEAMEGVQSQGKQKPSQGENEPSPQMRALTQKMEQAEADLKKTRAELESERLAKEKATREMAAKESLTRAKCLDTESALSYIEKNGTLVKGQDGVVKAKVKSIRFPGVEDEISLDDFVKEHVMPAKPHLFEGSRSSGSPANGDQAAGGQAYKYDYSQVTDNIEFYQANKKDIDAALARGEVRGQPRTHEEAAAYQQQHRKARAT